MIWHTRPLTARDDRGREAEFLNRERMSGSPVLRNSRLRMVVYRAMMMLVAPHRSMKALDGLTRIAVFAATYFLLAGMLATWARTLVAMAATVFTPPVFAPLWRRRLRRTSASVAAFLSRHAICPGCMYDLETVPREPDGCAVCPECGGAWRVGEARRRSVPILEGTIKADGTARLELGASSGTSIVGDDRRRPTHLCAPDLATPIVLAESEDHRGSLIAARADLAGDGRWIRWPVGSAFIVLGLGFTAFMTYAALSPRFLGGQGGTFLFLPLAGVFMAWMGVSVLRGNFGYRPRRVTRKMLAHGLCPGCGADLSGEPEGADGCRECYWCGSAWRVPINPSSGDSP